MKDKESLIINSILAFLLVVLIEAGFLYFLISMFFSFTFKRLYLFLIIYNLFVGIRKVKK